MMDGVNIDVAVVQLVELEIVILVVADSNSAGHPNNEGMVEKYTTHSHAGLSLSELCLYIWHFLHQILESSASGSKPDLKSGPSETVRVQLLYSPPNL